MASYTTGSLRRPKQSKRDWRAGFSLIEVVFATGLCTFALGTIACMLPVGLIAFQNANQQTVNTEVFGKIWLELNTTPFYSLPTYPRFSTGTANSTAAGGLGGADPSYFDMAGEEITGNAGASTSAVYTVRCSLVNSTTLATLNTVPPVDGLGTSANAVVTAGGAGLTFVKIQIGFHVDPKIAAIGDRRVSTRTYLLAKRDTVNGN